MGTFVTAYLAVWLVVMLYVLRLGIRQRRLEQNLEALQARLQPTRKAEPSVSRAA